MTAIVETVLPLRRPNVVRDYQGVAEDEDEPVAPPDARPVVGETPRAS